MKHIHTLPPILLIGLLLTLSSLPTVQAATNCAAVSEISKAQCDTLVALYDNTNGWYWNNRTGQTGWKVTNTPCSGWYGIVCSGGNVTTIFLGSNGLKGSLPDLNALTGLQSIYLSGNQLTGVIPNLSKLTKLRSLQLDNNRFTGPIPDLSTLTNLQDLWLYNNQLTGPIPDLSTLTNLQSLRLNDNQLTDSIPSFLNSLTTLTSIYLNNNQLSGSVPDLSKLTSLGSLWLSNNQLSGSIPDLSKLTNLWSLSLSNNQLSGSIPSLNSLTKLTTLQLSNNPQLCRDPNTDYGTQTAVYSVSVCPPGTIQGTKFDDLNGNGIQDTGEKGLPNEPIFIRNNDLSDKGMGGLYFAATDVNGKFSSTGHDAARFTLWTKIPDGAVQTTPVKEMGMAPYDVNLAQSQTLQIDFGINFGTTLSTLTVTKTGNGVGVVATADAKLNCGTTCQNDFTANTAVTLFAISSAGSTFTGWSGDCTGTDTSITLTLDVAKTCVANFATVPTDTVENCPTTPVDTGVTLPNTGPDLGAVNSSETISSSVPLPEYPFCAQVTEIPKAQCQTLLAIYDNTAGTTWTHQDGWNTTTTPCQWYGVECTIGQVTALRLANNNLQGTLPTLAALTSLKQLAVEDNLLKGTLPDLPTSLETFTGDRNQLAGPLTPVSTLTSLRTLSLSNNQLSDALPDLGQLTQLERLNLNNNQLVGAIPDLHKLTQLQQLLLKDNHLAGPIPTFTVTDTFDLNGNDQLCRDPNLTYSQPTLNTYPSCSYPTLTVAKTGSGIGLVSATSTTDPADTLNCGPDCVQTNQPYTPASTVTLTATPTPGTIFTGWLGQCNGDTQTTTVTLDQAKTCVANFEIEAGYYELQLSKTGIGKGLVTTPNKNDPLHCDAKCQETRQLYPAGTTLTLRAEARTGSLFTGWGGACSGTERRVVVTLDQAKSCFANFNLEEPPPPAMYQLIINTYAGNGKGTVTALGIDCGIDCLENYQNGKYVKLTATPHPGSSFLGWEDDCSGKDPTLSLQMTDNKLCTAFFANDLEMTANETVTDFYTNGYLDTGEEVQDRYPRYPDNDQRLQEAFLLAQPAILTVDLQVEVSQLEDTWPIQFNSGMSFFRLQPAGVYTESVKILKDAIVEGYLAPAQVMGYYVEVRVKLLNYLGGEEWVPILNYWGEPPQESGIKAGDRDVRIPCKGASCNGNGGGGGGKRGIGYRPQ